VNSATDAVFEIEVEFGFEFEIGVEFGFEIEIEAEPGFESEFALEFEKPVSGVTVVPSAISNNINKYIQCLLKSLRPPLKFFVDRA